MLGMTQARELGVDVVDGGVMKRHVGQSRRHRLRCDEPLSPRLAQMPLARAQQPPHHLGLRERQGHSHARPRFSTRTGLPPIDGGIAMARLVASRTPSTCG